MHASAIATVGLVIAALPLSACDSARIVLSPLVATTTVSATVTQIPGSSPQRATLAAAALNVWTGGPQGTGLFAIGSETRDGLVAIPQGRYDVRVASGADSGDWMLCDTALCGPAFQGNATVVGHAVAPYSSVIYLGPKSRTLWVDNLVLSPVAPVSGPPPVVPVPAS